MVGFEFEEDAQRYLVALQERLKRFKLELHPDKAKLVRFREHSSSQAGGTAGDHMSHSFGFLGFDHWWGKKGNGRYDVIRRTERRRMRATLKAVKRQLTRRRHDPVPEQGRWLAQVLRGYFAYYAVPTSRRTIGRFRTEVIRIWRRQLRQRSQRTVLNWKRMDRLSRRWLPPARTQHPWPERRFHAKTRGGSPVR